MNMKNNMQDKVCLVTGANAGLGKATALALAKMGGTVIMVARSQARGEAALAEVRQAGGSDKVQLLLADLSSMESVRQLAATVQASYGRLDVLVNNAGAVFQRPSGVGGWLRNDVCPQPSELLFTD